MLKKSSEGQASPRPRRWMALGGIVVALGIAGCGSSSSNSGSSSSSTPATETKAPAQETKAPASESSSSGIPQGEHAGDGDGDNKGGPSDGDGNI
jgi:hypothetical protein